MRMRSMFVASQEALRTIEQNLTNREMLARVIRSEGLAEDGGAAMLGRSRVDATAKTSATPKPRSHFAHPAETSGRHDVYSHGRSARPARFPEWSKLPFAAARV